jgi:hypothetical protein
MFLTNKKLSFMIVNRPLSLHETWFHRKRQEGVLKNNLFSLEHDENFCRRNLTISSSNKVCRPSSCLEESNELIAWETVTSWHSSKSLTTIITICRLLPFFRLFYFHLIQDSRLRDSRTQWTQWTTEQNKRKSMTNVNLILKLSFLFPVKNTGRLWPWMNAARNEPLSVDCLTLSLPQTRNWSVLTGMSTCLNTLTSPDHVSSASLQDSDIVVKVDAPLQQCVSWTAIFHNKRFIISPVVLVPKTAKNAFYWDSWGCEKTERIPYEHFKGSAWMVRVSNFSEPPESPSFSLLIYNLKLKSCTLSSHAVF